MSTFQVPTTTLQRRLLASRFLQGNSNPLPTKQLRISSATRLISVSEEFEDHYQHLGCDIA